MVVDIYDPILLVPVRVLLTPLDRFDVTIANKLGSKDGGVTMDILGGDSVGGRHQGNPERTQSREQIVSNSGLQVTRKRWGRFKRIHNDRP
jgi:hypothetical protein